MHILDATAPVLMYRYRAEYDIVEWNDFQEKFSCEADAISFIYTTKWPDGFRCPRCDHHHAYVITSRKLPLYQCHGCHHQTSLTAGTIMENTRTPLLKWLIAFFLVSRSVSGINAAALKVRINVTYKTSWTMLHVIRRAISMMDNEQPLSGPIHGGIAFCSQLPYSSTTALHPQEKPVLIGASVDQYKKPVIVKMKLVDSKLMRTKHLTYTSVREFTEKHVAFETEEISLLQRFAFVRYRSIKNLFKHTIFHLNRTFKGLSSRYLQLYLDEACYRINQSLQNKPIFENLTHLCMSSKRPKLSMSTK